MFSDEFENRLKDLGLYISAKKPVVAPTAIVFRPSSQLDFVNVFYANHSYGEANMSRQHISNGGRKKNVFENALKEAKFLFFRVHLIAPQVNFHYSALDFNLFAYNENAYNQPLL